MTPSTRKLPRAVGDAAQAAIAASDDLAGTP
jgi:hypothetical protein